MATDIFYVVHMNLLGFTLDSRTNFCDADAGGYLGQEATEVGLFKGVIYTAKFKMGVISFELKNHSSCLRVWRRCLKETIYYLPQRNWEHTNYACETDTDVRVELSSYSTPSTAASTSSSPGTRLTRREALSLIRRRENCWKR